MPSARARPLPTRRGAFSIFDWYAVTFDGQDTFMGFVVVHGDPSNAEYGYFSLSELRGITHIGMKVSRDLNWEPIPARCIGIAR